MSEITVWSPLGINRVEARPQVGPGKHSAFIPTFGTSKSVTRTIEGDGAIEGTPGPPANGRI